MKKTKDKVTIKDIISLGYYGKMYPNSEVYPHTLRKLSLDVKKSDSTAIAMAALLLSQRISPNAVLIPLPQSSGRADYTLQLAETIRIIRQDCTVIDLLSGTPRKKLFEIKKSKSSLKGVRTGIKVMETVDCKTILESNPNIYFVDNVVNTGFTFMRARKALRKYVKIEPSLLAISATCNWFN